VSRLAPTDMTTPEPTTPLTLSPTPGTARRRGRRPARPRVRFEDKLVLFQWMLSLFEVDSFQKLADLLKQASLGFNEDNVSYYCQALQARIFEREHLSADLLLRYDQNIVRHWKQITEKRNRKGHILYPKYFQYLALLFTEIYLDRFFSDPSSLLADLNAQAEVLNADRARGDRVKPYNPEDLNKVALWCATGSGKTLLMHINILQYRHYLRLHGQEKSLNMTILLTPNEGLSRQHLAEFGLSGIKAELFAKEGGRLFGGRDVEIIDIHKLKEETGPKTVAVESFEGNNLVLVDEGHSGASSTDLGHWMTMRRSLCAHGFSFEYSATFGQAVGKHRQENLEQLYAKCIILDYSYKFFYRDGYGKEYRILNLADDSDEAIRLRYLTASLLAFYQQQKLYADRKHELRPFLLERPLWVFVGHSVNAVSKESGRDVSDVLDILLFLSYFVRHREQVEEYLGQLLQGRSGILDRHGTDTFSNVFTYLYSLNTSPQDLYNDVLKVLFNASSAGSIHIENLKGTGGEIAVRVGDNEPFGLIYVGDAPKLCKLCEDHTELVVQSQEFSGSLFHSLNEGDSTIKVLIGSRKFTEGWNSWRVSTMGLMNVGRKKGVEIIQLFGRGVRLKGHNLTLKRSSQVPGLKAPRHTELLETLNIFGIRANYMKQFKEYLEEEGLPTEDQRDEIILPVIKNLGTKRLKMIRLPKELDFKRDGPKPTLGLSDNGANRCRVFLDWYPKVQAMASKRIRQPLELAKKNEASFSRKHTAFMNLEEIFFELQRYKNEKTWFNLNLRMESLKVLLEDPSWYQLYIPAEELEFTDFDRIRRWQEIATTLLKKYCDRYYKLCRQEWESKHLEYIELSEDDPNFIEQYRFLVEQSRQDIVEKLLELKGYIEQGHLRELEFQGLSVITFSNHLYEPLVYVTGGLVEVRPVVLQNEGERDFVLDLRKFCNAKREFFEGKELYLLRNMSRGRGIGFFEAGNFHPDFIMWLVNGDKQHIAFIDPKGLRNLEGPNDPKIAFYKTVKRLKEQPQLADPHVILSSFIIASTPYNIIKWWGLTKSELEERNVLFQRDNRDTYISNLLGKLTSPQPAFARMEISPLKPM